ncbi:MAG: hypothetical protein J5663_11785 [Bacteroidaceae bacterium]|nr:hypothetical protein [Bacteroidaceae bacterium]
MKIQRKIHECGEAPIIMWVILALFVALFVALLGMFLWYLITRRMPIAVTEEGIIHHRDLITWDRIDGFREERKGRIRILLKDAGGKEGVGNAFARFCQKFHVQSYGKYQIDYDDYSGSASEFLEYLKSEKARYTAPNIKY